MIMAWLALLAWLTGGALLGAASFGALWWQAGRFAGGGSMVAVIVGSLARLAVLGACLAWASQQGASTLLAMALGLLIARAAVTRRARLLPLRTGAR